jgi:tetratricopeptide (TPR) repeat protein
MNSTGGVRAWQDTVAIPTYPAPPPDRNPMFLEKRVYQGSSGKVYPNPFTDRVSDIKIDREYIALHLENEFIRLMMLPEIGGRIHIGQDKSNGYDFFYQQHVIKPALVGLLGPWISGGVEFNWPQHHRPSTFMPVDFSIEHDEDGSRTVWLGEHEPMNRMKGMVGICLYPGKAIVEAKVRLYNRTPFVQTFLWWANAGIQVNERHQAFFPPDVTFVADHAKRAMSSYPIARNLYYGVDYTSGVDISWYKNIPVPTSYMVTRSDYDFFGGYDHSKRAGVVHVAERHIVPGKKLWTWGNAEFGYAWDRELTDDDGPYIELMAGAFTDNQPDFSFLAPYETRTFSQFWYPIRGIGPVKNANRLLAINFERAAQGGSTWNAGVYATEPLENVRLVVTSGADTVLDRTLTLRAGEWHIAEAAARSSDLLLRVLDSAGRELIRYRPIEHGETRPPDPARAPARPSEIATADELYVTGLHLAQYRHATRNGDEYWLEAIRRDALDARCNNALGIETLRRGEFVEAEKYFRAAIARLTALNPNPYDGEPYYNLGLAFRYQRRFEEAHAAFYKAVWNRAWQGPAYYELALIDSRRHDYATALERIQASLDADPRNLKARNLRTVLLRRMGRTDAALAEAQATAAMDALDYWSRWELDRLRGEAPSRETLRDSQTCLDIAFDYADAGLFENAMELLQRLALSGAGPMVYYSLALFAEYSGDAEAARRFRTMASAASPDYCFPSRLEELIALEAALRANPDDPRAHYYAGNLLYDRQRKEEAIAHWERSSQLEPAFSIASRNLGIAYFNVRRDPRRALEAYEAAMHANPPDARVFYEFDQLRKRTGTAPEDRLEALEARRDLVSQRDDLTVELVTLYNQLRRYGDALAILESRRFHPWEGGEGLVSGQYVIAHLFAGRDALEDAGIELALSHFEAARHYPGNLGEGKHLLTQETHLDYLTGEALAAAGKPDRARRYWEQAAAPVTATNRFSYYRALSLRALGRGDEGRSELRAVEDFANRGIEEKLQIDYFATSLPNFLLFEDDLQARNRVECLFLRGLAKQGLNRPEEAALDFRAALVLDRNHVWADDELRRLEAARTEARR